MKAGGIGGGSTRTGLEFEGKVDFLTAISRVAGYSVAPDGNETRVLFEGRTVARCYRKHAFYKFLALRGAGRWDELISKRLLPDDALFVPSIRTVFIVEIKFQQVAGSVDEKLQTCDFKRQQYLKLLEGTGVTVEYVYVLGDWFKKAEYRDVLEYIQRVGCHYFFGVLPLEFLGLPASTTK